MPPAPTFDRSTIRGCCTAPSKAFKVMALGDRKSAGLTNSTLASTPGVRPSPPPTHKVPLQVDKPKPEVILFQISSAYSMGVLWPSALCISLRWSMLPNAIGPLAGSLHLIAPHGARAVNGRRWRDNRAQVWCKAKTPHCAALLYDGARGSQDRQ